MKAQQLRFAFFFRGRHDVLFAILFCGYSRNYVAILLYPLFALFGLFGTHVINGERYSGRLVELLSKLDWVSSGPEAVLYIICYCTFINCIVYNIQYNAIILTEKLTPMVPPTILSSR